MENLGQMDDAFFDAWQDDLFSLQSDVQTRLSTMLQGDKLLSRDAISISVGLCHNIIDDLEFLESKVGPDFPWSNRFPYLAEILYDVVMNILKNLEAMIDKICALDRKKAIHRDYMYN